MEDDRDALVCAVCGGPMPPRTHKGGCPRKYCSLKCKHRGDTWYERYKAWAKKNPDAVKEHKRKGLERSKAEGLAHYGAYCHCCGEIRIEFLTMEHIGGRPKGIIRRTGKQAWLRAKRLGWPVDITILCFNCNSAKGIYGYCPHEKEREDEWT